MLFFKKVTIVFSLLFLNFSLQINSVLASIQLDEYFVATKTCQAVQSIRMGRNPGNIHLTKDKIYHVIAKDRNIESHYLIEMPEQDIIPSVRWIAKNCGEFVEVESIDTVNKN